MSLRFEKLNNIGPHSVITYKGGTGLLWLAVTLNGTPLSVTHFCTVLQLLAKPGYSIRSPN